MLVTDAVFQAPIFWLNTVVVPRIPENIPSMSATLAVFQDPMFWLNAGLLKF